MGAPRMFLSRFAIAFFAAGLVFGSPLAFAEEHQHEQSAPEAQKWSFSGPFGLFDRAQLQRGFQVYREVCSACHGLNRLSYRNLVQPGGPEIPEEQVKALLKSLSEDGKKVKDINDKGEQVERSPELKDFVVNPFPNPLAAAAVHGKAPPDLTLIAKARTYHRGFPTFLFDAITGANSDTGPNYIYGFLTGYSEPPAGVEIPATGNYNRVFPGNWVAMPNILSDGLVTYQDGTPGTVKNYAKDVTTFLMWAAEPKLEERKRLGFQALVFLVFFSGLLWFTKKKVWAKVPH